MQLQAITKHYENKDLNQRKKSKRDGVTFIITFIDDFSKRVWLYVLESKKDCFEKFKEFEALVETHFKQKIKTFRLDNGREFVSKAFNIFFEGSWYWEAKWSTGACKFYYYENGKKHVSCSKPEQIFLSGNSGYYGLHTKLLSNKGVGFHYAQGSLKGNETSHYTHACVWMRYLCNDAT